MKGKLNMNPMQVGARPLLTNFGDFLNQHKDVKIVVDVALSKSDSTFFFYNSFGKPINNSKYTTITYKLPFETEIDDKTVTIEDKKDIANIIYTDMTEIKNPF